MPTNDVIEYLVNGASGIDPGGVDGTVLVSGVCSLGVVGKGYLLGKRSDLTGLLGVGPLVDRLRDMFATGGQEPVVIAVPVAGQPGGYISPVEYYGTGPVITTSGVAGDNADVVLKIETGGQLGTATYQLSEDGGNNYSAATATPANGQVTVGATGVTLVLSEGEYQADDSYIVSVRKPIGVIEKIGTGPEISTAGTVMCAAEVKLVITGAGGRNEGTYKLSIDGGDNYSAIRTIPVDGAIAVGSTGVTVTVPDSDMVLGDTYNFRLYPPVPTISDVLTTLEKPLELFDVEQIYVVGPSDSADWVAVGVKADEMWNAHSPTYFKMETRLPYANEDLSEWAAALIAERQGVAHDFVMPVAAFGEVADSTGKSLVRNWGGLQIGRVLSIPVQRATGRVKDGPISPGTLPDDFNETIQQQLETNGFITAKRYAKLQGAYWGDSRTLADVTSDYQYEEVIRTIFKAVRIARIAALKSMYDEAGDPIAEGGASGLAYLKANIEGAIHNRMIKAKPKELAAVIAEIPPNQDIVNNGVAVELDLIGIPIIRRIKLFVRYIYAGSRFDPRIEGVAVAA
jgi:hypothetical protein